MRLRTHLTFLLAIVAMPSEVAAQLDPLVFLKRTQPNIILMLDTSNRMQRDHNDDYRDKHVYTKASLSATDQVLLGISSSNTTTSYRRKFVNLVHITPSASSEKFEADQIDIVGDLEGTAYSQFDARTRINIAKVSLREAIYRNNSVARFSLMKTRQSSPSYPSSGLPNEGPVKILDVVQSNPSPGDGSNKWKITRPEVTMNNGSVTVGTTLTCSTSGVTCVVAADASGANASVLSTLSLATGATNSLIPAGRDSSTQLDSPIDLMITDIKSEVVRLANADDAKSLTSSPYRQCRNSVAVLVVGGVQGNSTSGDPSTLAADFLSIGTGPSGGGPHRVPIYVIALAPNSGADMSELQAVAEASGGEYTEITPAMVEATTAGDPVPEFVAAVNKAIQHGYASQANCDIDPTTALPVGPYTEHQVTSPIVGTVYLKDASDINGNPLDDSLTDFDETYLTKSDGSEIPQRSNVMITSAFSLPGFDGKLRAFRTYKPEEDDSKAVGYKFTADGTRLWVACAPGTETTGFTSTPCTSLTTSQRNIYTALPDGTVVAFTAANATTLRPYLLPTTRHPSATAATAETLIEFIRSQPLGAVVGSTPALMDPPSLDPPPDSEYPGFKVDNANRRSMVWVGANDGMLHAIDARLGVEVWAFIPFNLLPKLYTLQSGQPVGDFNYFVDGSPKVADVKVDLGSGDEWRTFLIMGEGAGGTFYQTFDVTLEDLALSAGPTDDDVADVLTYFTSTTSVPLVWSFPRYSVFDVELGCNATTTLCTGSSATLVYGELKSTATAAEKSVGETWSDPAVGQIESADGPYAVLTGSGFYKNSMQTTYRGGTAAGTTFYIIDAETGDVLDSANVGNDGLAESGTAGDSCDAANDCTKVKNALQADPVATGPADSRFINKTYIGDLDGRIWRFDISLNADTMAPDIATPLQLYDAGASHPMFSSMATVNVGTTQQYLFQGTGSEFLPADNANLQYKLLVILDGGTTGTKKAEILLEKTDSSGNDEKVTAFPAVAGDIVFFATTTYKPLTPCESPLGNLYAFTFIGGPAYDTTGDGLIKTTGAASGRDSTKVQTSTGRATAPFIVDQHLVFGTGTNIEMFGDDEDFNNGVGQAGVRILSWREVR